MNLENRTTMRESVSVNLDPRDLPAIEGSSFCWSLSAVLHSLGKDIPYADVSGFSLSAFSIWAHPVCGIKLWPEHYAHLFTPLLLDCLGIQKIVVVGRSGYFCPQCQKKRS